ncbi:hypothetical protein ACT29H_02915 [Thermophagus sp. OGC60D27]|uniref:hypothetical protein n=1 Tax=Thermophagus sp. OGC60D27 TaxID=3458415 RepID=UPI00403790B4
MKQSFLILSSLLCLWPLAVKSQNSTSSPYSVYGFGVLESTTNTINSGMGGSGVALPSEGYLNYQNPASLSTLDSLSFYFNIQAKGIVNNYSLSGKEQSNFDSNIDAFSFGFRVAPFWGLSFGLYPFSSVGYTIEQENDILGSSMTYPVTLEGSGGLSRFSMSNGFQLSKNFSVGLDASFIWGSTDITETADYSDLGQNNIINTRKWYFNNLFLKYGFQYQGRWKHGTLFAGASWQPETNLYATFNQTIENESETSYYEEDAAADDVILPGIYSLGVARSWDKGWTLSADYSFSQWSVLNDYSTLKGSFSDAYTVNAGIAYSHPKNKSKLINRMEWRAGMFYSDGYLKVKGQKIGEKGITAGLSLPLNRTGNILHISYAYSLKGTGQAGLIREQYHTIKIGFSMAERWFSKNMFY